MTLVAPCIPATALPDDPGAACAGFLAEIAPEVRAAAGREPALVVLFAPADPAHAAWRLAAIQQLAQQLARATAPATRVNAVVVNPANEEATAEVIRFALTAPGITGQIIAVAGNPPQSA
ncbi:MAG: Rossmann fold domain-containing protein [Alteraurantiacibacter sp.]